MFPRLLRILPLTAVLAAMFACTQDAEQVAPGLLQHVPADTPYAFVTSELLPEDLRDRLGKHYAVQLASQRAAFARVRKQLEETEDTGPMAQKGRELFAVLDALFTEFEGRDSVAELRELGIEPVTRSVFYGIGVLPALRVEIADAAKLNAMLDRVEQRAGVSATRGELAGQGYRRIDLGDVDIVLAVSDRHLIGGLLADALFDRDLPLLLGQSLPEHSLAAAGDIKALIERYAFTGYGEGFIRLDELVATVLGEGSVRNREVMQALGAMSPPVSDGCTQLARQVVAGMPRMVMGIRAADDKQMVTRGIWESTPAVASYLQKLAAPVPGVGAAHNGLVAFGMGLDLPRLRNGIDALLRFVSANGGQCEWIDPDTLQAVMPQLNLALGPMTAGIKGFNLQIDDIAIDPQTLEPTNISAGLLAAVDDPRGIFALGAMFNPALAAIQIPDDGSFVEVPSELGLEQGTPPLKVAVRDRALLLLAGGASAELAAQLSNAVAVTPSPVLAIDYGVHQLVERFGDVMERAADDLGARGELDIAAEVRDQLNSLRLQAQVFDRLRVSVHASEDGMVMDQVMELR